MNIKESQLKAEIKKIVREAIDQRKYQAMLSEVSPPGAKSERMIQHVKKSLRDSHPNWSDEKITSVAIATAWKAHDKKKQEESLNERDSDKKSTDAGELVRAMIKRGITDPDKIQQLASQWNVKYGDKPIDLGSLDQVIQKELGNPEDEIADENYVPRPEDLDEASYKVVSPNQVDTAEEDKARTIQTEPEVNENDDKWIQHAIDPSHKGWCTPLSNPHCTGHRRQLALRMKHGDIHHDNEMKEAVDEAKKWLNKAIDQSHKGFCTPMSKSTCTPHRKALAKRAKSGDIHADNEKKQEENIQEDYWLKNAVDKSHKGYCTPMSKSTCTPKRKALAKRMKSGDIHADNEKKQEENIDETAYKVQGRSYKTFADSPKGDTNYKDDPENT